MRGNDQGHTSSWTAWWYPIRKIAARLWADIRQGTCHGLPNWSHLPTTASHRVYTMLQQDCPIAEHEKTDSQNYSSKNAHKQRPPRNHAGVGPPNRPQINQIRSNKVKGHFTSCCFSKNVSFLREDDNPEPEKDSSLGCLESQGETQWHATVNLNQKFKLDTGTEVTAISEATFSS